MSAVPWTSGDADFDEADSSSPSPWVPAKCAALAALPQRGHVVLFFGHESKTFLGERMADLYCEVRTALCPRPDSEFTAAKSSNRCKAERGKSKVD